MTVSNALGALPDYILEKLGERAYEKCLNRAGLFSSVLNQTGGYLPEIAIARFLDQAARESGSELFGVGVAPILTVRDYGMWGNYILAAPTLAAALDRAVKTIGLHANVDSLSLVIGENTARFSYVFGVRNHSGYAQVAYAATGAMLSVPRHFLGSRWTPISIGLDIPAPRNPETVEQAFGCPVRFDRKAIEVDLMTKDLSCSSTAPRNMKITISDIWRELSGPPSSYREIVASILRQNFGLQSMNVDDVARFLDTSVRSIQRRLDADGTTFRRVLLETKMQRAIDLLQHDSWNTSEVAAHLDYSTPSHFARAFKAEIGMAPSDFALNAKRSQPSWPKDRKHRHCDRERKFDPPPGSVPLVSLDS